MYNSSNAQSGIKDEAEDVVDSIRDDKPGVAWHDFTL